MDSEAMMIFFKRILRSLDCLWSMYTARELDCSYVELKLESAFQSRQCKLCYSRESPVPGVKLDSNSEEAASVIENKSPVLFRGRPILRRWRE